MLLARFAFAALSAVAPLAHPLQDEAALRTGIDQLETHIAKAEWSALGAAARSLLEAHADQPYVWLHLPELREALQMARFHAEYKAPRWEQLTSGELLSYNENSGSIKLRYTRKTIDDFHKRELNVRSPRASPSALAVQQYPWIYVHPAHFHGEYSVELRGEALQQSVEFLLMFNDADSALVSSGSHTLRLQHDTGVHVPAQVRTLRGDVWTQSAHREETPCVIGKPFALKLSVGNNRLSVTYKDRPLLSADKPSGAFGSFALTSMIGVDEVLIQGRAQTSWLQGKRDEHLEAAWQKQFAGRAAYRVLPERLRPFFHEYARPIRSDRFPRAPSQRVRELTEKCVGANRLDLALAMAEISRLPDSELDTCMRNWLNALCFSLLDLWDPALEACTKVTGDEPRFVPGLRLGAHLQARLRRFDEAIANLRAALLLEPNDFDSLADLARLLIDLERFEEFRDLLLERALEGGFSETLDQLNAIGLRAQRGPRWAKSHTLETERYRIVTDIDEKTCRETSRMLEESLKRFEARLRPAPRERVERFTVYVFSGRAGYTRYARDALDFSAQHTAGLYHRSLRQLLVWNQPSRAEMFETIRHEALHQYLHRFSDDVPVWLNEGLAECVENAQFQRGPSEELRPHPGHLRVLRGAPLSAVAIERFLRVTPREFYADNALNYALAWSLTHLLLTSNPTWRRCLDRMLDKVTERASAQAVVDAGFEGVDFEKLAADLRKHLDDLAR